MTKNYGTTTNGRLELVSTDQFEKSIKKVRGKLLERVINTAKKIESGLGHEHPLTGNFAGMSSIYVSDGGRVIFTKDYQNRRVLLNQYDSTHAYRA